jgi:signal recognition particle subunit SRP54
MENNLSSKLSMLIRRISGKATLNEKDIEDMVKEIRLSLLDSDVNFQVVRELTNRIKEKALGEKILKGLNPGQQVVKVVRDELKEILGSETRLIKLNDKSLTTIVLIGLQGSGKTTSIAKLAVHLRKTYAKKVLAVACDIYRPAAINQLIALGKTYDFEVYSEENNKNAVKIAESGKKYALANGFDCVLIDTAGRLQIDKELMDELVDIKKAIKPDEILLTLDSMNGQAAPNVAKTFFDYVSATGVILTKLDGDTKGGAALSVSFISHVPILFSSSGEKADTFEVFHPDRMADRILDMGDVVSLIEKVEENIDEEEAELLASRMAEGKFDYNDMLKQFKQIKKMGSISSILGFLPGFSQMKQMKKEIDDKELFKAEAMIQSMTKEERSNPELLSLSGRRRYRIASGSGCTIDDVNRLRQSLDKQVKMMKQISRMDEDTLASMMGNLGKKK